MLNTSLFWLKKQTETNLTAEVQEWLIDVPESAGYYDDDVVVNDVEPDTEGTKEPENSNGTQTEELRRTIDRLVLAP